MSEMKASSSKRVVTIEEHEVSMSKRDIADMLEADGDEPVDPRDLTICVAVNNVEGKTTQAIGATQLVEMARSQNKDIPEDAEVVISLKWKREVEGVQLPVQAPSKVLPGTVDPAAIAASLAARAAGVPAPQAVDPADAAQCATCGAVPGIQGPTPECEDANGCGRVRSARGDLPIAQAVAPANAPAAGQVGLPGAAPVSGAHYLISPTGKKLMAGKDGTPYGYHDDYEK